jgi:murein DD-endopeptidase MepM/ murein hydrolase activator NlpD
MRHGASTGREILERAANGRILALVVSIAGFGFFFVSSAGSAVFSGTAGPQTAVGAADISDANQAGAEDVLAEVQPPPDEGLFYTVYRVVKGDTISEIADRYGITTDSIITFNAITNARALSIGKYLKIPTLNGILYEVKKGDTAASLAASFKISEERINDVNRTGDVPLEAGRTLFLPDARLSSWALREISGDLFSWPVRGWITSWYGWRNDPFTGSRSFHSGLDIGSTKGAPIRAAMEGVVSSTGYSTTSGNYVVLRHHSGYTTLYAHLDRIDVKPGRSVTQSTIIGTVGNTGYSTGSHLHFTVSKHGRTMNPMTVLH